MYAIRSYYDPAGIIDLKDAIVWMRKHAKKYHINPDKIAILGASSGAQMATLIGVTPNSSKYKLNNHVSDEVQAIINIDGITSFIHQEADRITSYNVCYTKLLRCKRCSQRLSS